MERLHGGALDNDFRRKVLLRSCFQFYLSSPVMHALLRECFLLQHNTSTFDRVIRVRCAMNPALDYRATTVTQLLRRWAHIIIFCRVYYIFLFLLVVQYNFVHFESGEFNTWVNLYSHFFFAIKRDQERKYFSN